MNNILIVVDMQRDFIDGALGTAEAAAIVAPVAEKIRGFNGKIICTLDTHGEDYLSTQEGRRLPVKHCIKNSEGHRLHPAILDALERGSQWFEKNTFGSAALGEFLARENETNPISSVELVGLCTDICVISNAMIIKAYLPEVPVSVDSSCCAGVTTESHLTALNAMAACQIDIK